MTNYTFGLPVTSEQLEAIGMVAAEWSYLESVIDAAIWTNADIWNEDVGKAITAHLTLKSRLDILETVLSLAVNQDEPDNRLVALKAIRRVIEGGLSGRRNEVIHGRWITGSYGSPMTYTVQARGVLKHNRRWIAPEEIRAIAELAAEQAVKLRELFGIDETEDDD